MRSSLARVRKASAWADGAGRLRRQQGRLLNLFPGFVVFALVGQQEPQRQACFELLWVRGNGFAVVGGGRILVVAGILDIAKIEQRAGVAGVLAAGTSPAGAAHPRNPSDRSCFPPLPFGADAAVGLRCPAPGFPAGADSGPVPSLGGRAPAITPRPEGTITSLIAQPAPLAPPGQAQANVPCASRGSAPPAPVCPPLPPGRPRHPPPDPDRSPSPPT